MAVLKIVWPRKFCKSGTTLWTMLIWLNGTRSIRSNSNKHLDECSEPFPDVVLVKRRFLQEEVNIISTERKNANIVKDRIVIINCTISICAIISSSLVCSLNSCIKAQHHHSWLTSYQPLSLDFKSSGHLKKTALPSPSASSSAS